MENLSVENFRVLEKRTNFQTPLITILTGKNNVGKSTIHKAILLLNDFINGENQTQLSLDGPFSFKHKINSFGNARTWDSKKKSIEFGFIHNELESIFIFTGNDEDSYATLDSYTARLVEINDSLELKRLSQNQFELKVSQLFIDFLSRHQAKESSQKNLELFSLENELAVLKKSRAAMLQDEEKVKKGSKVYVDIRTQLQRINRRIELIEERMDKETEFENKRTFVFQSTVEINEDDNSRSLISLIRKGLLDYFKEERKDKKGTLRYAASSDFNMGLFRFGDQLHRRINFSVFHLSPNRFKQERLYIKNDESEINRALSDFVAHKPRKGSIADAFLKKWLMEFEIGDEIEAKNVEGSATTIHILRKGKGKSINLADMGFGAGQILTILLKITNIINDRQNTRQIVRRFRFSPIVLIEEPETNLHPYVQSKLAELFYDAASEHEIKFILETHSEYLIRKFQVLVKEREDNSFIKVYYFEKDKPFDMELANNGKFQKEFGKGFIDEAARQVLNLL